MFSFNPIRSSFGLCQLKCLLGLPKRKWYDGTLSRGVRHLQTKNNVSSKSRAELRSMANGRNALCGTARMFQFDTQVVRRAHWHKLLHGSEDDAAEVHDGNPRF